ncbi:hypothetical protein M405DRAFT_935534 [Rhizopogon salebrosus TDB-379]|nr:hypothetical protein M405DRAFT_935534 [Rhizopogon salebrosus TDB-379]
MSLVPVTSPISVSRTLWTSSSGAWARPACAKSNYRFATTVRGFRVARPEAKSKFNIDTQKNDGCLPAFYTLTRVVSVQTLFQYYLHPPVLSPLS